MNQREENIFEIPKSQNLKILSKIVSPKVKSFYNARIIYASEWFPTPKGICLPLEMLEDQKKTIDEAYQLYVNSLAKESPEAIKEK
jgi:hypothetical protein